MIIADIKVCVRIFSLRNVNKVKDDELNSTGKSKLLFLFIMNNVTVKFINLVRKKISRRQQFTRDSRTIIKVLDFNGMPRKCKMRKRKM